MNSAGAGIQGRQRHIPKSKLQKIAAGGKVAMYRASEERLKQEQAARADRQARLEPVHAALRTAFENLPELTLARGALSALPKREPSPRLPHSSAPYTPKAPIVKLGSMYPVDTGLFQTRSWISEWGDNSLTVPPVVDSETGAMSFFLAPANLGGGGVSCWVALGQIYAPGKDQGTLIFGANPSYSWNAWWNSTLWCEVAGKLWIGQAVNRFDASGTYIDTPVLTQNLLLSFDDHRFNDSQNPSGASAGNMLSTSIPVEGDLFYECWVWIGGFAAANDISGGGWSHADMEISAHIGAFTLELR